ncbi:MAG: electron transfer flavoprotein subunit beta/FixA family protein [Bacillota bacterium]|jgi:electron transfer flavoprotein beta subunit|nr:electron transfer flavoprotein subunit beta/FixA family protein [Bacillota bacterium]
MRIIVLLKQPVKGGNSLERAALIGRDSGDDAQIGYDDGNALEMALRLKEKAEQGTVEIIALAAGISDEEEVLREALALGADQAVLLSDAGLAAADSMATARCLAAAIRQIGAYDLILAGYKSQDKKEGHVGSMVAEFLCLPQITHVNEFQVTEESVEAIADQGDGFSLKLRAPLPCCLSMNKMKHSLRIMTLQGVRQSLKKDLLRWTFQDIRLEGEDWFERTLVTHKFSVRHRDKGQILNLIDQEQIEALLRPFLGDIKSSFLKRA